MKTTRAVSVAGPVRRRPRARSFAAALGPVLACVPVVAALACSSAGSDPAGGVESAVNYRATTGQEYSLEADVRFVLTGKEQTAAIDKLQEVLETAARTRVDAITTAVNSDLAKRWPDDERTAKKGVAVMLRQASPTAAGITMVDDGATYAFHYSLEFGAKFDIEKQLGAVDRDGKRVLELDVPDLVNTGNSVTDGHLALEVKKVDRSRNSYPRYEALFEDGLDIHIQVGGDYNESRADQRYAKAFFAEFVRLGFTPPVGTIEELKLDSAPFKRTYRVKGNDVEVRIKLVHAELTTPETRNLLIDSYKNAAKTADIIYYGGHAGTSLDYSGIAVAYKPSRVALPASEFKNLDVPEKQQVYVFDGCETYTGYADKLYENPKKTPENTDVVTVVNFSAMQAMPNQAFGFLHSILAEKAGEWLPHSWDSILETINTAADKSWVHVYGVHGIDDNPKLSPIADVTKFGATCKADADCGAQDSYCLTVGEGAEGKRCGLACADTAGCPGGARCAFLKGYTSSNDKQCIPGSP